MSIDSDRYRRAQEVFASVADLPASQQFFRAAEECADDQELLTLVHALLRMDASLERSSDSLELSLDDLDLCAEARLVGAKVGRYLVQQLIGSGGMGAVYQALQEEPRRRVALKVMHGGMRSQSTAWRFKQEADLLARLDHPGIAKIYEAGSVELEGSTLSFIAMELVSSARSITEYVTVERLGIKDRVELFARVCAAVQHGHQKGMIHRDIKPENVLIDEQGQPRLIDFGVARLVDADESATASHTRAGDLVGTIRYMSPEQFDPDPNLVDIRSDVYALGIVLYEVLSGSLPYDVSNLSVPAAARRISESRPAIPMIAGKEAPRLLVAILFKALEPDRDRRYSSAASLESDLKRYLAGQPLEAQPPGRWQRVAGWIGENPIKTTACLCMVLLLTTVLSLLMGVWFVSFRPARILLDEELGRATLLARDDSVLAEWPRDREGSVFRASLVDQPDRLVGGSLALVAFSLSGDGRNHDGRVDAYQTSAPFNLLWSTDSLPLEIPEDAPDHSEWPFELIEFLVADMLPGIPGEETLIVNRVKPFSQCAVRIIDVQGRLQFEAWHDGSIFNAIWLPAPGLVVMSAVDGQYEWHERLDETTARDYPIMVMALRPEERPPRASAWLVRDGLIIDEAVEWCRWLGPVDELAALGRIRIRLEWSAGRYPRSSFFRVNLRASPGDPPADSAYLSITAGVDGNEVSRFTDDSYGRLLEAGLLPPDSTYQLTDYAALPFPGPPGVGESPAGAPD